MSRLAASICPIAPSIGFECHIRWLLLVWDTLKMTSCDSRRYHLWVSAFRLTFVPLFTLGSCHPSCQLANNFPRLLNSYYLKYNFRYE